MNYENYKRIMDNIRLQAPLECGVQTLVYMLLDEVISKKYKDGEVRVLVADLRNNRSIFGGKGGVIDLCIVNNCFEYVDYPKDVEEIKEFCDDKIIRLLKEFNYSQIKQKKEITLLNNNGRTDARREKLIEINEKLRDKFNEHKRNRWGCVEVKPTNAKLPTNIWQLAGHVIEYKRVLYTNGCVWQFFDLVDPEICRGDKKEFIEDFENVFAEYDKLLEKKKKKEPYNKDNLKQCEKKLRDYLYGAGEDSNSLKKWDYELIKDEIIKVVPKERMEELVKKIQKIEWEKQETNTKD